MRFCVCLGRKNFYFRRPVFQSYYHHELAVLNIVQLTYRTPLDFHEAIEIALSYCRDSVEILGSLGLKYWLPQDLSEADPNREKPAVEKN